MCYRNTFQPMGEETWGETLYHVVCGRCLWRVCALVTGVCYGVCVLVTVAGLSERLAGGSRL